MSKNRGKHIIKKLISKTGYELRNIDYYLNKNSFNYQKELLKLASVSSNIIIDAGAYDGTIAKAYTDTFPNSTIYSFEPYSLSFEKLKKNTKGIKKIKPIHSALSNTSGKQNLNINNATATNSLLKSDMSNSNFKEILATNSEEQVDVIKLDDFTKENKIAQIDILKMDIQGGELNALMGANELLTGNKINIIYTEVEFAQMYKNQPLFSDVTQYLAKRNYSLFNIYNMVNDTNGKLLWADALFINKDIEEKIKNKNIL